VISLLFLRGKDLEPTKGRLAQIKSSIGNRIFVHHRVVSAVKGVEFVSDRVSYIVVRGRWDNMIVLNVHALSEEKSDDSRNSFYEELENVFDHFP
jgi:hypothetical protein